MTCMQLVKMKDTTSIFTYMMCRKIYDPTYGKARVCIFDIHVHRMSLRPEVVKIECQFSKGLYKIIEMFMLQKYA